MPRGYLGLAVFLISFYMLTRGEIGWPAGMASMMAVVRPVIFVCSIVAGTFFFGVTSVMNTITYDRRELARVHFGRLFNVPQKRFALYALEFIAAWELVVQALRLLKMI